MSKLPRKREVLLLSRLPSGHVYWCHWLEPQKQLSNFWPLFFGETKETVMHEQCHFDLITCLINWILPWQESYSGSICDCPCAENRRADVRTETFHCVFSAVWRFQTLVTCHPRQRAREETHIRCPRTAMQDKSGQRQQFASVACCIQTTAPIRLDQVRLEAGKETSCFVIVARAAQTLLIIFRLTWSDLCPICDWAPATHGSQLGPPRSCQPTIRRSATAFLIFSCGADCLCVGYKHEHLDTRIRVVWCRYTMMTWKRRSGEQRLGETGWISRRDSSQRGAPVHIETRTHVAKMPKKYCDSRDGELSPESPFQVEH